MLVSGRNNVKEVLKNLKDFDSVNYAILQDNFNENDILSLLKSKNIKIKTMKKYEMDRLVKLNHQGVVLDVRDYRYCDIESIINGSGNKTIVILDHLEDPHNLGAIIRTCEAAGIDGIILPLNRSVSVNETVMKVSTGALYHVKIAQVTNLLNTIKMLKKRGYWIIGADMNGESYKEIKYPEKTCLIIGSEGFGMQRVVRESCDFIASIPMNGKVNSLNASVAAGILIYEAINR